MAGVNVLFWNWLSLRKNKFKPRPQNRILVPRRGSFQIFDEQPRPFYMGVSPRPPGID